MKKKIELDVDFIGGGPTPTKEEFLAISEYIKHLKLNRNQETNVKLYGQNVKQNNLHNNGTNSQQAHPI